LWLFEKVEKRASDPEFEFESGPEVPDLDPVSELLDFAYVDQIPFEFPWP